MNNRCICCPARAGEEVRLDLIKILGALAERKEELDHVVIESTGLANPAPIAQTFFLHEGVKEHFTLDAVVTMIDALHIDKQLSHTPEAKDQVAFADRLVINKTDLVEPDELAAVRNTLSGINPLADVLEAEPHARGVSIDDVLDLRAFSLDRILQERPGFLTDTEHVHDKHVKSVGLIVEQPLDPDKVQAWMQSVLHDQGEDVLRFKGILNVEASSKQFVFQGVHTIFDGRLGRPWRRDEARESRVVFIGRGLDREALEAGLLSCCV